MGRGAWVTSVQDFPCNNRVLFHNLTAESLKGGARVGLTELKLKELQEKKFDKLFEKHKKEWVDLANHAFAAARDHICGGNAPRPDDILKMLLPMLEPNETLRKHQEDNRARFKHYRESFGEYVIDKVFFTSQEE
jgi:hypothetical protein